MDETNPVFENFRNKMRAFGKPIRGTTRKVSASKFLGKDDIEKRIEINARKITILKNIIQTQQMATGEMIKSLTEESPVKTIENDILNIKDTLSSIVKTLEAQQEFERKSFEETGKQLENERRRKKENLLEKTGKKIKSVIQSTTNAIVNPVKNVFLGIIRFFTTLFFGKIIMSFVNFLSDPKNLQIVLGIADFIEGNFPLIVTGITAGFVALSLFAGKLLGISTLLRLATGVNIGGGLLSKGIGMRGMAMAKGQNLGQKVSMTTNFSGAPPGARLFNMPTPNVTYKFNKGGIVPGQGNTDTVPAMLTPGEIVISKPAVEKYGALNLLRLNENVGKTNRPKINNNKFYFNDAGQVPNMPSGFGDLFNMMSGIQNQMKDLESGSVGKELKNFNPIKLQETAEKFKLDKSEARNIPINIMNIVGNRLGQDIDTSKIEKSLNKLNEIKPSMITDKLNTVLEESPIGDSKNIQELFKKIKPPVDLLKTPPPPTEELDDGQGAIDNLLEKVGGNLNLFTQSAGMEESVNDIPEGQLAKADPKVLAILGMGVA